MNKTFLILIFAATTIIKVFDTRRQMVENAYGEFIPTESPYLSSDHYYNKLLQVVSDITPRY